MATSQSLQIVKYQWVGGSPVQQGKERHCGGTGDKAWIKETESLPMKRPRGHC